MPAVLLACSERKKREVLLFDLRAAGFHVATVGNLAAAIEASTRCDPFVLLVEPALLEMEGAPLRGRVDQAAGRLVPILALTHNPTPAEKAAADRHGASFLTQPLYEFDGLPGQLRELAPTAPTPEGFETTFGDNLGPGLFAPLGGQGVTGEQRPAALSPEGEVLAWEVVGNGTGPTILLVDDSPTSRMVLGRMLLSGNFRVFVTDSAVHALRFVKTNPDLDLVVSDLFMAEMNGLQLKDQIDRWRGSAMPFLLITAAETAETTALAAAMGTVAVVRKPVTNAPAFFGIVHAALQRR